MLYRWQNQFMRLGRRNNLQYFAYSNDMKHEIKLDMFKYEERLEKYRDKILFNSFLDRNKLVTSYIKIHQQHQKKERQETKRSVELRSLPPLPVSLKYITDESNIGNEQNEHILEKSENEVVQMPFDKVDTIQLTKEKQDIIEDEFDCSDMHQWMKNYEYFDDAKLYSDNESDDEENLSWTRNYGTPDPTCKISNVPCGGCGALLHCTDVAIPGYIPSEIFKGRNRTELQTIECQRCHFLKEYNVALNINVDPKEYLSLLELIKNKRALVIIMVDLLDFPCSIYPKLIDIVGTKRPVIIVGNKIDVIPGDEKGYLKRIEQRLIQEVNKTSLKDANIKAISLISAKTGYGIEELISNLFKIWFCKGDVYLIGCTNVGKSSLFNALLQSDYCKVQAHDLIKRATVSRWPGTTLNLLKFPINRISGWKIYERNKRLKADEQLLQAEKTFLEQNQTRSSKTPVLIGHIGRSFVDPKKLEVQQSDLFSYGKPGNVDSALCLNEQDGIFAQSKWFYDTPGVVHPDQILSLLTAEELLSVLPKGMIQPHSYFLQPGKSILIAGIACLDFIDCKYPCRFTVFCSEKLPITICETNNVEEIYKNFLATDLLAVPKGSNERMKKWMGLTASNAIIVTGEGTKQCCADIVLSTAGWISITAPNNLDCKVLAWTPEARGIHIRNPPLLKYGVMLKGKRIRDTPAYRFETPHKKNISQ